jgi:plasmid stabilization system protein ParE
VTQTILTDRAILDIQKAKNWYEKQQKHLGKKFVEDVFKNIELLQEQPFAFPNKYKFVREIQLKKYPYLVIYSVEENIIFILRIFPTKTNPKKKYSKI